MFEVKDTVKTRKISYVVFFFALLIICFSLVSLFFPALIVTTFSDSYSNVNPFERGSWFIPVLITNIIIFDFGLLYYKKKLPKIIYNSIEFILNFEVSRKIAIIIIIILLGGYVILSVEKLAEDESVKNPDFDFRIQPILDNFPFDEDGRPMMNVLLVKNSLLFTSQQVFDNVKIIPFIGSIMLLLMTYFFTAKIANKRFAGLVAMVILIQSHIFLRYDTSAAYSNFWILFYLLSLYMIYKKWYLSPVGFILSTFSKLLSVAFLPMTFFFVYNSDISKKTKILITISYGIVIGISVLILLTNTDFDQKTTVFNFDEFLVGFTALASQIRSDSLVLLFILPLVVGLFLVSRKGIRVADSIQFLISGIIFIMPLLVALTNWNISPYRYISVIVFFAIGVGTLLSKRITQQV